MPKITSNTIVKNGMPFIKNVLEQVEPYMEKMLITLSKKSSDGTKDIIDAFVRKHSSKVLLFYEDVKEPSELTEERNKQVRNTDSDWLLFLDDDDYWPKDQLELCLRELDKDQNILAYATAPFNLIDFESYDASWERKFFSKFLRREGLRFRKPWPRDLPYDVNGSMLYWKTHPQVKTLPYRFFHLAYLKDHSFRKEEWAKKFEYHQGKKVKLIEPFKL